MRRKRRRRRRTWRRRRRRTWRGGGGGGGGAGGGGAGGGVRGAGSKKEQEQEEEQEEVDTSVHSACHGGQYLPVSGPAGWSRGNPLGFGQKYRIPTYPHATPRQLPHANLCDMAIGQQTRRRPSTSAASAPRPAPPPLPPPPPRRFPARCTGRGASTRTQNAMSQLLTRTTKSNRRNPKMQDAPISVAAGVVG